MIKVLCNSASVGGRVSSGEVVKVIRETPNYYCIQETSHHGEDKVRKSDFSKKWVFI